MMYTEEVTMAEIFSAAGYRTGIFGKWHLGDNYPLRSIDQGFQESLVHNGGGIGQPSDPPGNHYVDPVLQHNGKAEKRSGYCTDIFTNAALEFIEANRGRPFFTYLATNAPHTPLEIDERYVAPYRSPGLDETTVRIYGMIANLDENIGRLLAKLNALDLERDTLLIFMTDNGPQQRRYNAGMRGLKGSVYEGGIRVPCFFRWKGALRPRVMNRLAAHIDVLPTLLEACGLPKSSTAELDGRSLWPLLNGKSAAWSDRTLYFQWHRGDVPELYRSCAARSGRYKLVNGKELYDLMTDPAEKRDIAARQPEVVTRMRKGYEDWFRNVSATRGYDPPRIHLGTPHENPVVLTRQDWRGPRAGWAPDSLGHWETEVTRPGPYQIRLRFPPAEAAGEAQFQSGGLALKQAFQAGADSVTFTAVELPTGKARLEPCLRFDAKTIGVHYVDIEVQQGV
jgi:arylsulfatase A-like enzyme